MTNYVDEEVRVQRLVDGEMTLEERREFFQDLDSSPAEWRRVSLAFVEDQVWRTEYQSLYRQTEPAPKLNTTTTTSGDISFRHVIFLIAASVMASTTAGYWMGDRSTQGEAIGTALDSDSNRDPLEGVKGPANVVRDDQNPSSDKTYRLQFVSDRNGRSEVVEIPVVESEDPWTQPEPRLPDNFRNSLLDSGYDVKQNTHYISGRLDDGRHVVLPVNRVDARYRGQ